jgi:hypothetical protein
MFPYLIYVENDVMGITKRIKEIDPGYFVMFNPRTQRYEVHHSEQPGGTLCVEIPYNELDSRAVDYVQRTRVENAKKIMAEMETRNAKLEIDKAKAFHDRTTEAAKDIYTYCNRHTDKETVDSGAFKTRFV